MKYTLSYKINYLNLVKLNMHHIHQVCRFRFPHGARGALTRDLRPIWKLVHIAFNILKKRYICEEYH